MLKIAIFLTLVGSQIGTSLDTLAAGNYGSWEDRNQSV